MYTLLDTSPPQPSSVRRDLLDHREFDNIKRLRPLSRLVGGTTFRTFLAKPQVSCDLLHIEIWENFRRLCEKHGWTPRTFSHRRFKASKRSGNPHPHAPRANDAAARFLVAEPERGQGQT